MDRPTASRPFTLMAHEVSQFELQQLRVSLATKEAEVNELRGALSGSVLHLEGEAAALREEVERERRRGREVEQIFDQLHTDYHAHAGMLCAIFLQVNGEVDGLGLRPFIPYPAFDENKVDHLALAFHHLGTKLDSLHQWMGAAQDTKVERATTTITSCILAYVHHAAPDFQVEVVLEDLSFKDQEEAGCVVADVADAVVKMEKDNDFGNT